MLGSWNRSKYYFLRIILFCTKLRPPKQRYVCRASEFAPVCRAPEFAPICRAPECSEWSEQKSIKKSIEKGKWGDGHGALEGLCRLLQDLPPLEIHRHPTPRQAAQRDGEGGREGMGRGDRPFVRMADGDGGTPSLLRYLVQGKQRGVGRPTSTRRRGVGLGGGGQGYPPSRKRFMGRKDKQGGRGRWQMGAGAPLPPAFDFLVPGSFCFQHHASRARKKTRLVLLPL